MSQPRIYIDVSNLPMVPLVTWAKGMGFLLQNDNGHLWFDKQPTPQEDQEQSDD